MWLKIRYRSDFLKWDLCPSGSLDSYFDVTIFTATNLHRSEHNCCTLLIKPHPDLTRPTLPKVLTNSKTCCFHGDPKRFDGWLFEFCPAGVQSSSLPSVGCGDAEHGHASVSDVQKHQGNAEGPPAPSGRHTRQRIEQDLR